jgi:hypothetical protein
MNHLSNRREKVPGALERPRNLDLRDHIRGIVGAVPQRQVPGEHLAQPRGIDLAPAD